MRDSKEFKDRFLRWKDGKLVYENGRALPVFEDGLTPIKKSTESGNAAFVSNIRNSENVKKINDFLNKHPAYPIMVDNGRYSHYMTSYPNAGVYSGLNSPNDMFIVGTVGYKNGKLPKFEGGENPEVEKYINATTDENNGKYWQQSPFNNPVILFLDPSGITSYPQVKEAFDKGNTYDKVIGILGATPAVGKVLRPVSKFGSVVNTPSDTKSFLDWNDYYKSIVYKDNRSGRIGLRRNIGSYDHNDFANDVSSGNIRRATPDEIKWWYAYNTNGYLDPSPGLPLGSVIGKTLKQRKQHRQ